MDIVKNYKVINEIGESLLNTIRLIYIFKQNEVIMLTNDDEFYSFGRNEFGCLGTGNDETLDRPTKILELCGNEIVDMVSGHYHVMARTQTGKVFSWGQNNCAQLGNGEMNNDFHKPQLISELMGEKIIQICCGYSHSLALNDKGQVFAWGSNEWGEVGMGEDKSYQVKPVRLTGFGRDKILSISCGFHHSVALTESKKVYTWGSGWLRTKEISEPNTPKIVRVLRGARDIRINSIACGQEHCLLLSAENEIYAFGKNTWDQSENSISEYAQAPVKLKHSLENLSKMEFEEIAASPHCNISAGLTLDGTFVIWSEISGDSIVFPRITKLKSFYDIFASYAQQQFTYKPIEISALRIPNRPSRDEVYYSEYEELGVLQSGKYGLVCKAKNIFEKSEVYAIKKIPIKLDSIEDSLRIVDKLSRLNSDHVVKYINVWIEENYFQIDDTTSMFDEFETSTIYSKILKSGDSHLLHIQMELCYETLKFAIDKLKVEIDPDSSEFYDKLNYFILCELFSEILESISYLHRQSEPIIHRYLNPAKILITHGLNGKFIKIADFSCRLIHANDHEDMISTKEYKYIAPEILDYLDCTSGNSNLPKRYGTKADIWSAGKIVREMFNHYFEKFIKARNDNILIDESMHLKVLKLYEISKSMLFYDSEDRPNCEKIQDEKNSWYIGLENLEDIPDFHHRANQAIKTWEIQDSLHLYFLRKKLEWTNKDHVKLNKRLSLLIDYEKNLKYESDFREVTSLGSGAFANVFEVEERKSGCKFAIKMIPIEKNNKNYAVREIEILTRLKGEFVVECKSVWIEDNNSLLEKLKKKPKLNGSSSFVYLERPVLLFIQMELCYKTLREIISVVCNELRLNFDSRMYPIGYYVACELFIEILESVSYLHKCNPKIIHRDLKPTNILITFGMNGRFVKLADFGLSTLHESDDQSHSTDKGTKSYMAPEVLESRRYDTRSDIYSIGTIMPQVFNFNTKNGKLNSSSNSRILKHIPGKYECLQELIDSMTHKDFNQRPSCEAALSSSLKWRLDLKEIKEESFLTNIRTEPPENIQANFHKFLILKKMEQSGVN